MEKRPHAYRSRERIGLGLRTGRHAVGDSLPSLSVSGPKYWSNILQIKCSQLKEDRVPPVYVNVALMHQPT